jgi:hypothetical protein
MKTPSEEGAPRALLLWADSLPYCTGFCTGPPGLRIRIHFIQIQGFNDQKLKKNYS